MLLEFYHTLNVHMNMLFSVDWYRDKIMLLYILFFSKYVKKYIY